MYRDLPDSIAKGRNLPKTRLTFSQAGASIHRWNETHELLDLHESGDVVSTARFRFPEQRVGVKKPDDCQPQSSGFFCAFTQPVATFARG